MKLVLMFLSLFALTAFSGCSCKNVPFVACEKEYITQPPKIVKITKKCTAPVTFCDKEGSLRDGSIGELLACIVELRRAKGKCVEDAEK